MPADKVKSAAKPKRMRKKAKEYAKCRGVGTKSQQALKALHEQTNCERRAKTKARKAEDGELAFEKKRQKKKQKHKGR